MKKLTAVLIIFMLLFSLSGCVSQHAPEGIAREFDDPAIYEGQFTTKTFVEYITANDVGLSVDDFEQSDVSIEEFLAWDWLTPSKVEVYELDLAHEFEEYVRMKSILEENELASAIRRNVAFRQKGLLERYWVYELKSVKSSKDDYHDFAQRYFQALTLDAVLIEEQKNGVSVYQAEIGEDTLRFYFCQTSKSEGLPIKYITVDERYKIKMPAGEQSYYLDIYHSNEGRFLMYIDGIGFGAALDSERFDTLLKLVKTFSELDE